MKRFISVLIALITLMAFMAIPASAASLGISPSHIEVEVPQGGSTPVDFQVHFFSGELRVSLVDIPLEVEPTVFHITSSPTDIVVTFRDNTFDPQEYNGYVRFLGVSQDTVALAVNIGARVTVELSANIVERPSPPPSGGGGIGPRRVSPGTTDVRGEVSAEGVFEEPVTAFSDDELCTLTIPEGTEGLTEEREPLDEITILREDDPPEPPEEADIVLAYDLGPDGATFEPAITLTFSYDPADIPEGKDVLVVAYYDEIAEAWVYLEGEVDTVSKTITVSISHFTTFAIIARVPPPPPAAFSVTNLSVKPLEIEPKEVVTISLSVANTGGTKGSYTVVLKINGVKEAERSVTIAAGKSQGVSFSLLSKEKAGSYSVVVDGLSASFTVVEPVPEEVVAPPEEEEVVPEAPVEAPPEVKTVVNWPLVGVVIAAVVVVLLISFLIIRRRAY